MFFKKNNKSKKIAIDDVIDCPKEVSTIFLEMLTAVLIKIRNSEDLDYSRKLAYHTHNIPNLIQNYTHEKLKFYLEVERPDFIKRVGEEKVDIFLVDWKKLDKYYSRVKV